MRTLLALAALTLLPACVLAQDAYDSESLKQCRELPTPQERLQCERDDHDARSDRRYNNERGMVEKGHYTFPRSLCPTDDDDACDFD